MAMHSGAWRLNGAENENVDRVVRSVNAFHRGMCIFTEVPKPLFSLPEFNGESSSEVVLTISEFRAATEVDIGDLPPKISRLMICPTSADAIPIAAPAATSLP